MQTDGNLVVYSPSNQPLWSTGTYNDPGARAIMQSDGNFVLYSPSNQPLWWTRPAPPWAPNWSYPTGFKDFHDYSDEQCSAGCGEYGIDVPLAPGTPIDAPQRGTIIGYQPCPSGYCWHPGRLLERLSTGEVIGFGHVNPPVVAIPSIVQTGQEIATVAANTSDYGGPHVECMYDATGNGGPNFYYRLNFLPPPPITPTNGCPRKTWTYLGGTSVDPCVVLNDYMRGIAP
jgi:hypothetical protein